MEAEHIAQDRIDKMISDEYGVKSPEGGLQAARDRLEQARAAKAQADSRLGEAHEAWKKARNGGEAEG